MNPSDFSEISKHYEKTSVVQKDASDILFELLNIRSHEDVLDLGCGPGHLTQKIKAITKGLIAGVDPSEGMIRQAKEKYKHIEFIQSTAENFNFKERFDVILRPRYLIFSNRALLRDISIKNITICLFMKNTRKNFLKLSNSLLRNRQKMISFVWFSTEYF